MDLTINTEFAKQLQALKEQLPSILDDFEKYYVFYNMNPANNEYQQMFENIKNNLDSVNSKTNELSNNVDKLINNMNTKLSSLDVLIKNEKEKNKQLKLQLGTIEQKENSANILINNYKQLYDINYLNNWSLLLSIIVAGFAISKVSVSSNKILVG